MKNRNLQDIPSMALIFTAGDSFVSRLIRWWTRGQSSHTAIYVGSRRHLIAESLSKGNKITKLGKYLKKGITIWIYAYPSLTIEQMSLMKDYIYRTKHRKYDWKGALRFVFRRIPENPNKDYCSEWSSDTFNAGNVFVPNELNPADLQTYVIETRWNFIAKYIDGQLI